MTKKPEDLDMTTIVDRAFNAMLEATAMPGTLGKLSAAQKEAMKRSFIRPIHYALPVILSMLEEGDTVEGTLESDEAIISSFTVPDTLEGLLPDA